jgi:mRNA-degrading endonuclease RelE of RelBE toxin-antitoxin system
VTYAIEFRPSVKKNLRKVPQKELKKIKRKIDDLARNLPNPPSGGFV